MRIRSLALAFVFTVCAVSQMLPRGVEKKATVGGITEYAFPNGLRVLLMPDASSPKVTVNMTYLVGSRHEGYGETGMAHLLEHMLFILSTHNREIKKELVAHGASWNGSTSYDRTNYFETITATDENLTWALGLEAERMVNMRMEKQLLDTEMTVVRNEFEAGREQHQPGARRAGGGDGLPVAQLRQVHHRLARGYREGADRPPGGVLPEVLPAGQRGADHRRANRRIEGAGDGGATLRGDPAAAAEARSALHGGTGAGRAALCRTAARGRRPGDRGDVPRPGGGRIRMRRRCRCWPAL